MSSKTDEEGEKIKSEIIEDEEEATSLEEFLDLPEGFVQSLSETEDLNLLISKVSDYVDAKETQIVDYQNTVREFETHLEKRDSDIRSDQDRNSTLEAENATLAAKCIELEEALESLKNELTAKTEALSEVSEELDNSRRESHDNRLMAEELDEELRLVKQQLEVSRCPPDVPGADREELLRILDRRQSEINRLTEDWRMLSEKLEASSVAKYTIQTQLDDMTTTEATIKLKEQMFIRDKQLLQQQVDWLTSELENKNEMLLSLRKDHASLKNDKESELLVRQQEIDRLKETGISQKSLIEELQTRLDSANKKLLEQREEHVEVEDKLRRELSSQVKLSGLYQTASEEGESMVTELMDKVKELQHSLADIATDKDNLQESLTVLQTECTEQQTVDRDRIESLESELRNANDLLRVHSEVLPLAPMGNSTLSLTQMYTKYVESTEQLRNEKEENTRLNNYLTQISQELEEKTPALQKLRRDHDTVVKANQELQNKMEKIVEESEVLRVEAEESLKFSRTIERENKRLKSVTGDLSRQVQTLLHECEEARGGVVSSSHTLSFKMDDDVTSSDEVISTHLVEFRSIAELQEQNRKLLAVVRELGEEREREEKEGEMSAITEAKAKLDDALREIDNLRSGRVRQKEMVEAIVKQRDMYRVLLAQTTPLPNDSLVNVSKDSTIVSPMKAGQNEGVALAEIKEQFEAYRKEKAENDRILQEQIDVYRNEASSTRLDNAKLASKLEYANERYQMLDMSHKGLKSELSAMGKKESQLMSLLSRHQTTIDSLNKEVFGSKDRLSRLEVELQSLRSERESLHEAERHSRNLCEQLTREKHTQNMLLTNLQTIQNNMERSEFEMKKRLTARLDDLEKENVLLKEQNHGFEEKRTVMREAYERQIHELTLKHEEILASKKDTETTLHNAQESLKELQDQYNTTVTSLSTVTNELQESKDRVLAMEDDAGVEFRSKIRGLERLLADANAKVAKLTEEVGVSQKHCEEYRNISEQNETALRELNVTCDDFKQKMAEEIDRLKEREASLISERDSEKDNRINEVNDLQDELRQTQEALSQTQDRIETLQSLLDAAELSVESSKADVLVAQEEVKRYSVLSNTNQELYQREIMQHGKTMEELTSTREELETKSRDIVEVNANVEKLTAELQTLKDMLTEKEGNMAVENAKLKEHCEELTKQKELFHSEIERMSAKIVTLTDHTDHTPSSPSHQDDSSNLLEIVRYVKREKEIATTKREMAETECLELKHKTQKLEKELLDCQSQLKEITNTTRLYEESTVEYQEVLAKVQQLNVLSDSNTLLRSERDKLKDKVEGLEVKLNEYETQLLSSKDIQKQLTAQKDALLAEKAALKNEVDRWNKRTSQLIEQYNKIDPEEYKKLIEERDVRESEMTTLSTELAHAKETLESERKTAEECKIELSDQIQQLKEQVDAKGSELENSESETKKVKEKLAENVKINTKLRELGRKYRGLFEEKTKQYDEVVAAQKEADKHANEMKEASSQTHTDDSSNTDAIKQQAEATKQELDTVKMTLADKEDKFNKVVKTAKTLKVKYEGLKIEKESMLKELEEAKATVNQLTNQIDELKAENEAHTAEIEENLRHEYTTYTRELEEKIEKLEGDLRVKKRSHVVQPQVAESTSTTVPLPSAAVRPTVTTTPTASIRPMPLQVTTAPTAHVTPTQVSTSVPSVMESSVTQSSGGSGSGSQLASATVFVRSTSPLVQPGTSRSQLMPTTSSSSGSSDSMDSSRSVKRNREESNEYPPSKRCNVQTALEMEPSTTTTDTDPDPAPGPTDADPAPLISHVQSSDDVSPDTQNGNDRPNMDQSPPTSLGEADLPATIPADTTSDEATEPVEETGLTNSHVYEIPDDNEVINNDDVIIIDDNPLVVNEEGDEIVVMATEPLESATTENEPTGAGTRYKDGNRTVDERIRNEDDAIEDDNGDPEVDEDDYTPVDDDDDTDSVDDMDEEDELPEERSPPTLTIPAEESIGLPDDEPTVDLPAPQQITLASTTVHQHEPMHRLRLQMGDNRSHPPGVIDLMVDDHQVPCTPVLAEDKQLGKILPAQSVPAENNDDSSLQPSREISRPPSQERTRPPSQERTRPSSRESSFLQPPPLDKGVALDDVAILTTSALEERVHVGGDHIDIHEEVIGEIIGQDSSSDEEGQLIDSPKHADIPRATPITDNTPSMHVSTSTITDDSSMGVVSDNKPKVKPARIVWDQPSNSGQSSGEPPKKVAKSMLRRPSKGLHRGRGRGRGRGKQQ